MIELIAENGVFELPPIPQPWWLGPTHSALLAFLGFTVFAGPFVGGLLRWPPAHCLLLAWPSGFIALVLLAGGFGDLPGGGPVSLHRELVLGLFIAMWTAGVTNIAYAIGWIWRWFSLKRRGVRDGDWNGRHTWVQRFVYVSIPPTVVLATGASMLTLHQSVRVHYEWAVSEPAYANLLEGILQDPAANLPAHGFELTDLVRASAPNPDTRWDISYLDHYNVDPDGAGYELVVDGSPRRLRGRAGRLWITLDGERFRPPASAP